MIWRMLVSNRRPCRRRPSRPAANWPTCPASAIRLKTALQQAQQGLDDAQKQMQALQQQRADNVKQAQAGGAQAEQTLSQGRDAVAAAAKALADAQDEQKSTQQKLDQAKATIVQATADQTRLQADAQDADRHAAELPDRIAVLVATASQNAADLSGLQQQFQAAQERSVAAETDLTKAQQVVDADSQALTGREGYARQAQGRH